MLNQSQSPQFRASGRQVQVRLENISPNVLLIKEKSFPDPPPKSTGLLAQLTARIVPNKTQSQPTQPQPQHQQQQQQHDYERSRNEPIYQRRGSNQSNPYYDAQPIYNQQQQQIDGKNQNYSQSSHHQPYQQQQHQYNVYNQNIYVSTNPFISPPINNYSPSSFGKDVTANYSSNVTCEKF